MTGDKVREVLNCYRNKFQEMGIPQKRLSPKDPFPESNENMLAHCHAMLDEMESFIKDNRMEKVFRWLGFIQGCLWTTKIYTIEEVKNHNRPDLANLKRRY